MVKDKMRERETSETSFLRSCQDVDQRTLKGSWCDFQAHKILFYNIVYLLGVVIEIILSCLIFISSIRGLSKSKQAC